MTPEERRTAARIFARKEIEASFPDNVREAIASPVYGELYKNFILTGSPRPHPEQSSPEPRNLG